MFGHLLRNKKIIKVVNEGKIEGKRKREIPGMAFYKQIKEKDVVSRYKDV